MSKKAMMLCDSCAVREIRAGHAVPHAQEHGPNNARWSRMACEGCGQVEDCSHTTVDRPEGAVPSRRCQERFCPENGTEHVFREGVEVGWFCKAHADLHVADYVTTKQYGRSVDPNLLPCGHTIGQFCDCDMR